MTDRVRIREQWRLGPNHLSLLRADRGVMTPPRKFGDLAGGKSLYQLPEDGLLAAEEATQPVSFAITSSDSFGGPSDRLAGSIRVRVAEGDIGGMSAFVVVIPCGPAGADAVWRR